MEIGDREASLESANASAQHKDLAIGTADYHDQSKPECLESANASAQHKDLAIGIADYHDQSKPECLGSANASAQHKDLATGIADYHDQSKPEVRPESMEEMSSLSFSSSVLSDECFQIDVTGIGKPSTGFSGSSRSNKRPPVHGSLRIGSDSFGMKQSPPIQTMGRAEVPGPQRIPSSVFARSQSNSLMEWSMASSESLFSIQIDRPGDVTSNSGNQLESHPPISSHLDAPPPKGEVVPHSDSGASASQFSDGGSVSSYRSFAFPILASQGRTGSVKDESMCSVQLPTVKERPRSRPLSEDDTGDAQHSEEGKESPKVGPVATRRSCFKWPLCCWPSCCRWPSYCWPPRQRCPPCIPCCSFHSHCSCRCFKC